MEKDASPNILFFVCDDLRWDALSGMGHPIVQTPHLDRLMEAGTTFTHCRMPGSLVGAVCMPSRAMMHTGRSLFELEGSGETIPEEHTLMGEWLQGEGYHTFHTGKWHNGRHSFARSFSDGGAIFFGGMGDQWNMPVYDFDPGGRYAGKIPFVENPFHSKEIAYREGDRTTDGRHATEVFVEEAMRYLEARGNAPSPFFLSVALTAPHDPRNAPQAFHDRYPVDSIPLPNNFLAQHPHHTGALGGRDENLAALPRDPAEIRQHIADYYAMISHLDEQFGRLMETLEQGGLRENTLIIFTADHGLAVGQHGLLGKQCLYEHSLRVPLILSGPGLDRGKRIDTPVRHFDVMGTLADLLNRPLPTSATCRSLVPSMEGGAQNDPSLYLAYGDSVRGLLSDDWKLIEYAREGYRATQLFHLECDPDECRDRSHDPSCLDRLSALRGELERSGRDCGDRGVEEGNRFWQHWSGK